MLLAHERQHSQESTSSLLFSSSLSQSGIFLFSPFYDHHHAQSPSSALPPPPAPTKAAEIEWKRRWDELLEEEEKWRKEGKNA
jgi:hypothetical protein